MRHPVAREVEDWAEKEGLGSRPSCGARHGARGHVQRDDHGALTLRTAAGRFAANDSDLASYLRIEERELEAGGLN